MSFFSDTNVCCRCYVWLARWTGVMGVVLESEWTARPAYTYSRPSLPVEHRPPTTPRHHILCRAALVILDQLVPCCFSSASVSRLQLLRGQPLFLLPCGFQVRAWRVMLASWGCVQSSPLSPQYLLGHWFLSHSLPQISFPDLLLPLDFVDAPQTGVEEWDLPIPTLKHLALFWPRKFVELPSLYKFGLPYCAVSFTLTPCWQESD